VSKKANKLEIKNAVEKAYGVTIESVKTMNYPVQRKTKFTKSGVVESKVGAYKKAVVQLAEGDNIDFYSNI
jgi:large subunit ribosomal protein L23